MRIEVQASDRERAVSFVSLGERTHTRALVCKTGFRSLWNSCLPSRHTGLARPAGDFSASLSRCRSAGVGQSVGEGREREA